MEDNNALITMRNIFVCLTITISFRIVIEVFFEFKDGAKDKIFYLFLILRKFFNICVILILTISIKAVLEQVKTQQGMEEKLTKY
jgi:hypothetical protein